MVKKRAICFLIGFLIFALLAVSSVYTEENQTQSKEVSEEYTDDEMEEYIRWETEDYRRRDLQRGDIK